MPRRLTPEEKRLWSEVKKTIAPLHDGEEAQAEPAVLAPAPELSVRKPVKVRLPESAPARRPARKTSTGMFDGIDHHMSRRFVQGELAIDATLDLHGMSSPRAHERFMRFVEQGYTARQRMLLVITGKGRAGSGVLRAALPAWVSDESMARYVLALHPAQAHHGGDGAYYILLRRRRGG